MNAVFQLMQVQKALKPLENPRHFLLPGIFPLIAVIVVIALVIGDSPIWMPPHEGFALSLWSANTPIAPWRIDRFVHLPIIQPYQVT